MGAVEEAPGEICGYTLESDEVSSKVKEVITYGGRRSWAVGVQQSCCTRKSWDEAQSGRCVWHAAVDSKSTEMLESENPREAERVDGAYLKNSELAESSVLTDVELVAADLSGSDLRGIDLSGTDLRGADCSGADLRGTNLTEADIRAADLSNAKCLHHCRLAEADLRHALIKSGELVGTDLSGADLRFSDISRTVLKEADLLAALLNGADVSDANLDGANLSESIAKGTDFESATLDRCKLIEATLDYANFRDADLKGAYLDSAWMRNANLSDASLYDAELPDVDLQKSSLSNADVQRAEFSNAGLQYTTCEDVNARDATFRGANLESASLVRCDLRDADLVGARLYQTVVSDVLINSRTEFLSDEGEFSKCAYEQSTVLTDSDPLDEHPLTAAVWTYRRLQSLHEENALGERARIFHVYKNEAKRKYWLKEQAWTRYIISTANFYLTNHGESVKNIIYSSLLLIILCGFTYPFVGGILDGEESYYLKSFSGVLSVEGFQTITRTIYFSVITFTTIGFGNVAPRGIGSRLLVGVESLLGALFIAMFVFVLGRQVER